MKRILTLPSAVLLLALATSTTYSAGVWNGQDVYHVPISWCAVNGSPAADNPDITPLGSTTADTSTDAVLWRRHERPTDSSYSNVTGTTFRSAINDAWGTLNFPTIDDPDTTMGLEGDIRGEDVNAFGDEYSDVLQACDEEWDDLGRAGIGVTAVNVNLFHDAHHLVSGRAGRKRIAVRCGEVQHANVTST